MIRRTENVIKSPDKNLIYYVENDGKKIKDDNYLRVIADVFRKIYNLEEIEEDVINAPLDSVDEVTIAKRLVYNCKKRGTRN